jgi:hypothetical protein
MFSENRSTAEKVAHNWSANDQITAAMDEIHNRARNARMKHQASKEHKSPFVMPRAFEEYLDGRTGVTNRMENTSNCICKQSRSRGANHEKRLIANAASISIK